MEGYEAVRSSVGIREINDKNIISLTGSDRRDFLDRCVSNKVPERYESIRALYLDNDGKVKADMNILNLDKSTLVISSKVQQLKNEWEEEIFIEDIKITEKDYYIVDIQGPESDRYIEKLDTEKYIQFDKCGDGGYEVFFDSKITDIDIQNFNERESEILRVEAGIPNFQKELKGRLPLGFGLKDILNFDKCYPGQEIVTRAAQRGNIKKQMKGLDFKKQKSDLEREKIFKDEKKIGEITSIVNSPNFGGIGLAYIDKSIESNTKVITESGIEANIRSLPFYERKS